MNVKVLSLIVLAVTTALAGFANQRKDAVALTMDKLTVTKGLPTGCSLVTSKPFIGFSQPVPIDSNPWRGIDRGILASIREAM